MRDVPHTVDTHDTPTAEVLIKKSRFIARLRHVDDDTQFTDLLTYARNADRHANHHCFAYVLGIESSARVERFSDDGEPGGTAGAPILRTLKAHDLCNVGVVVSRYFGGIKLGAGGLTRAYARAAGAAIEQSTLRPLQRKAVFELSAGHADAGRVEAELRGRGFDVTNVQYGEAVHMTVLSVDGGALKVALNDISSGKADLVQYGHVWI
ncbi:IMPACT family protein [Mycobacterium sp. WMMD1722]|uniref:IMPACT family protein n=1 Tax=Mycobacterium sp. WMMD1722 TaxID=3404117 RepID=UPI003BF584E6